MSELYKLTVSQSLEKLKKREISVSELANACLNRIEATEPGLGACLTVMAEETRRDAALMDQKGPVSSQPLWGLPVTVKDVFCTKGTRTTGASKMLENYVPPYDAEVVARLKKAGALIVAKTNLDEFAMGSSTEFSAFKRTKNPWNPNKVPGGSSGGAAASVAAYQTPGAFGTDSGGSIRQPAALCGCVGLKPTYGRVSRYGIIAYASSFDQAGPLARRVEDCAHLLAAVAGPDERDSTASLHPVANYVATPPLNLKGLKLGMPKESWGLTLAPEIDEVLKKAVQSLEEAGATIIEVDLPHLRYAVAAYYILTTAEAGTNLARFDGVRYGYRAVNPKDLTELYIASRSESLGPEVRRRILLGTFALSAGYYEAYYKKAAQVRRLILEDHHNALEKCDYLISPVSTMPAWDFDSFTDDPLAAYQMDILTLPLNLSGLPGLSLPAGLGSSGLPVGLQLTGRSFSEAGLLGVGRAFEEIFPRFYNPEEVFVCAE